MVFLRFLAMGLLSGAVMLPFLWFQRGDESEYLRLVALMGLISVQFVMIAIMLAAGAWRVSFWSRRPRPAPPGLVLGGITFAFGAVVLTQAMTLSRRFGGWLSGAGDLDGERVMAAFAGLSGLVTLLVGAVILAARVVAVRRSREVNVPATTNG
ncbi:hypothetical protein ACLQ2R_03545 [Streptosporangium sp. DT93]|uniref:hypothetical protein n=1 Tax=Streptosporangium sp. DT93 TaxID=3393428 RepID=UPI003CF3B8C3